MGTFSAKMVHKRGRGWTSGQSLPILNFVNNPPPPPHPLGGQLKGRTSTLRDGAQCNRAWQSIIGLYSHNMHCN